MRSSVTCADDPIDRPAHQPERISGDPYTVKSDVWSLGITLVELAIGRFPFSSEDEPPSSGEEDEEGAFAKLSLDGVAEEAEDLLAELGDDTLSPTRPAKKRESIALAEKRRAEKRQAAATTPRSRKSSSTKRKAVAGVSLAGSGHQMSILELLQYIVNEPAPRLPMGKFSPEVEEFVNATLRKEPVGYNVKKKGPLPKEVARPTPKELLVSCSPLKHRHSVSQLLTRISILLRLPSPGIPLAGPVDDC